MQVTLYPTLSEPVEGTLELQTRSGEQALTFRVGVAGVSGVLEALNDHQGLLRTDSGSVPYYWCRAGNELHLWIAGDTYIFELRDGEGDGPARRSAEGALGDVTAPMPGVIRKVLVEVGDAVEAAAPLVVMESMKMQISLPAAGSGVVTEVRCEEGQMVEVGAVLLRLGPAQPEAAEP